MVKTQVEAIIFRKNKNKYEFLLLRRTKEKGGFWQPVAGGIEATDKSYLDATYREIYEEAGISKKDIIKVIEKVHYFEMSKHYLTGEPVPLVKEYAFGFEVKPDANVSISSNLCNEHDKFEWVSFEKAIEMLKWEDNKNSFRKLKILLNK
jgi:8-oxo-dGTP pyrophosphatase MutT (NUDIX family)